MNLPADLVASSFGKASRASMEDKEKVTGNQHLTRSKSYFEIFNCMIY